VNRGISFGALSAIGALVVALGVALE